MADAPRKKISHIIVKAIRDAGSEVFNDDLAKRVKLTREQVRNSVRQMMKDHPEYGIVETSPYYYVYDSTLTPAGSRPASAAPHIPTYDELVNQHTIFADDRPAPRGYSATMDQIFAADRAANPGKYPATQGHVAGVLADVAANTAREHCEFTVVTRHGDVVILSDEHSALWAAKKL